MSSLTEVLGLALTVSGVYMAIVVLWLWRDNALRHLLKKHKSPAAWVTLGIFIKHLFDVTDNGYWFFSWLGHYLSAPWSQFFLDWGYVANIPSRNIPLILASFCYLMAYYTYGKQGGDMPRKILLIAAGLGALTAVIVVSLKVWGGFSV